MFNRKLAIEDFIAFGGEGNEGAPQPAPQTIVMMGLSNVNCSQTEVVRQAVEHGFDLRSTRKCLAVWFQKKREEERQRKRNLKKTQLK